MFSTVSCIHGRLRDIISYFCFSVSAALTSYAGFSAASTAAVPRQCDVRRSAWWFVRTCVRVARVNKQRPRDYIIIEHVRTLSALGFVGHANRSPRIDSALSVFPTTRMVGERTVGVRSPDRVRTVRWMTYPSRFCGNTDVVTCCSPFTNRPSQAISRHGIHD